MQVRDGMTETVLTIGPGHTLRQAAKMMSARHIGAAVVIDPEHAGIGILTERDILDSVAAGEDQEAELAGEHRTEDLTFALGRGGSLEAIRPSRRDCARSTTRRRACSCAARLRSTSCGGRRSPSSVRVRAPATANPLRRRWATSSPPQALWSCPAWRVGSTRRRTVERSRQARP